MQSAIEGMQALNAVGIATKYFYTHDLPIPTCHNTVVEKALADSTVDKIFFLEEDMYIDPQAFVALATSNEDIAILQYNDRNGSPNGIIHRNETGEIIWTGLGAACIKRKVFEDIGFPYFRIDHRYRNIKHTNKDGVLVTEFEELEPRTIYNEETKKVEEVRDEYTYGGLDVDFYTRCRRLGYKITQLMEYKAHQFVLIKLGETYQNKGTHEIRQV
jgi:hypothetical protein